MWKCNPQVGSICRDEEFECTADATPLPLRSSPVAKTKNALAIGNRNIIAALQSLEATSLPQLKQHASSLLKRINNSEIIDETHFWNEVCR